MIGAFHLERRGAEARPPAAGKAAPALPAVLAPRPPAGGKPHANGRANGTAHSAQLEAILPMDGCSRLRDF